MRLAGVGEAGLGEQSEEYGFLSKYSGEAFSLCGLKWTGTSGENSAHDDMECVAAGKQRGSRAGSKAVPVRCVNTVDNEAVCRQSVANSPQRATAKTGV